MMKKKRVWCLYRVSTLGQVDHDDIPMQRDSCHKFVNNHPDWEIENELFEKGVSGFKKSVNDREALIGIKEAALAKQFDILLVFMFDRIGRRTDETPVIMQWLVNQGIEIWSVNEGQRKYETHEDELVGWIGTWLASGESRKISMRVRASKTTMADKGFYTGGYVPYGYDAERLGRVNKKDQPVRDLVINEQEAEIVRFIFHAIVELGYGSYMISNALNAKGIPTKRKNTVWRATSIRAITRNPIYIGRMKTASGLSEPFEQYRIVDDETFETASETLKSRAPDLNAERHGALRVSENERGLLTGVIYCAHCGNRMSINHFTQKKKAANGTVRTYEREVYRCNTRVYNKSGCTGRTVHDAKKIDEVVQDIVTHFFIKVKKKPKASMLRAAMSAEKNLLTIAIRQAEKALTKAKKDMSTLEDEAIKALTGEGAYSIDVINKLMPVQQKKLEDAQAEVARLTSERTAELDRQAKHLSEIERIQTWADSFRAASFDKKRVVIASIIDKISVTSVDDIEVALKLTARQYLSEVVEEQDEGDETNVI